MDPSTTAVTAQAEFIASAKGAKMGEVADMLVALAAERDALKAQNERLRDWRKWFFFPVEVPVTAEGYGPAKVGVDAARITYEVWDMRLNTVASFDNLADAIKQAMHLTAALQENPDD